eukprot:2540154-Pyramimonas_sp.AAC.1
MHVYESQLQAGAAPCFLTDGDHLRFKVRRRRSSDSRLVELPTPEWALATFAAGMEQQVPLGVADSAALAQQVTQDPHTLQVPPLFSCPHLAHCYD